LKGEYQGILRKVWRECFGGFQRADKKLSKRGLVAVENGFIKLTRLGLDLANQAFMEFV